MFRAGSSPQFSFFVRTYVVKDNKGNNKGVLCKINWWYDTFPNHVSCRFLNAQNKMSTTITYRSIKCSPTNNYTDDLLTRKIIIIWTTLTHNSKMHHQLTQHPIKRPKKISLLRILYLYIVQLGDLDKPARLTIRLLFGFASDSVFVELNKTNSETAMPSRAIN